MALERFPKLVIMPLKPSALLPIRVLFNPNSSSITKLVTWSAPGPSAVGSTGSGETQRKLNAPPSVFGGGDARQLTLELFFDVTESDVPAPLRDVRIETDQIVALTRIEPKQGRPPTCAVVWGRGSTQDLDRKSTRLNSSHGYISYAVFCLKKKKKATESKCRSSRSPVPPSTPTSSRG